MRTFSAVLPFLCLGSASLAADARPAGSTGNVDVEVARLINPSGGPAPFINGGVVAARNGKVIAYSAVGMADFAAAKPLKPDDVFQLASAAKPFTSVAILQLRDQGKVNLDDPVAKHIPGFPFPKITVRHVLTHTSGLPDLELFEPLIAREPNHVVRSADLIPALRSWDKPLRFEAGNDFRYSNINYQLLALLVQQVSGLPFGTYVRDRIFRPAGMSSSYVLGTKPHGRYRDPVVNHVLAVMYKTTPEDVRRLDYPDKRMMRPYRYEGFNLGSTVGDQNIFSTLGDLVKFDAALRSERLLSRASQEEAYGPARLNGGKLYDEPGVYDLYGARCSYGMGWEVCRHPTRGRLVGHAGFNRGIATMLYRALDSGQVVAMFDNGDTGAFEPKFVSIVNVLNGEKPVEVSRRRSLTRLYGQSLVEAGPTQALIQYNRLKSDSQQWVSNSAGMNQLGYDLLHNGYQQLALEPFRLNLILNPTDANAYDSYAEALAAGGRTSDAIAAYERSLELNPKNERGRKALERLRSQP